MNSRSPELIAELLHRFSVKLLIDLSCQDASWGAVALSKGVPYIGYCFSAAHVHYLALVCCWVYIIYPKHILHCLNLGMQLCFTTKSHTHTLLPTDRSRLFVNDWWCLSCLRSKMKILSCTQLNSHLWPGPKQAAVGFSSCCCHSACTHYILIKFRSALAHQTMYVVMSYITFMYHLFIDFRVVA
jgi:hypothetical protein